MYLFSMRRLAIKGLLGVVILFLICSAAFSQSGPTDNCNVYTTCDTCVGKYYNDFTTNVYCGWCADDAKCQSDKKSCVNYYAYPASRIIDSDAEDTALEVNPVSQRVFLREGDPLVVKITVKVNTQKNVQLYYLMDMSQSMEDDRENLIIQVPKLYDDLNYACNNNAGGGNCASFAFGTFIEKPIEPFGGWAKGNINLPVEWFSWDQTENAEPPYNYVFDHLLDFSELDGKSSSEKKNLLRESIDKTEPHRNIDHPETPLEALLQVATCDFVGWKDDERHIVFVATDADFHFSTDGIRGGLYARNPGTCYKSPFERKSFNMEALKYDYPSISQVRTALLNKNIVPVFVYPPTLIANEADNSKVFTDLKTTLGFGFNTLVTSSGDEVAAIVTQAYRSISSELNLKTQTNGYEVFVDRITPEIFAVNPEESSYEFDVTLMYKPEHKLLFLATSNFEVKFSVLGFGSSSVDISTSYDQCLCNATAVCSHEQCNSLDTGASCACGKCTCSSTFTGDKCDCSTSITNCTKGGGDLTCSGNGACKCDKCMCVDGYSGEFCDCIETDCPTKNGKECNDQGTCVCGKCECGSGYDGFDCSCATVVENGCNTNSDCGLDCSTAGIECRNETNHIITTGFSGSCEQVGTCTTKSCVCNVGGWVASLVDPKRACTCPDSLCEEFNGCNAVFNQGACVCGVCECNGFTGPSCEEKVGTCPSLIVDGVSEVCGGEDRGSCDLRTKTCLCHGEWEKSGENMPCDCFKLCIDDDTCSSASFAGGGSGTCKCSLKEHVQVPLFYEPLEEISIAEDTNFDHIEFVKTCFCTRSENDKFSRWTTAAGAGEFNSQCQCRDIQCMSGTNGEVCSGNGRCDCDGRCVCDEGWSGDACGCDQRNCPEVTRIEIKPLGTEIETSNGVDFKVKKQFFSDGQFVPVPGNFIKLGIVDIRDASLVKIDSAEVLNVKNGHIEITATHIKVMQGENELYSKGPITWSTKVVILINENVGVPFSEVCGGVKNGVCSCGSLCKCVEEMNGFLKPSNAEFVNSVGRYQNDCSCPTSKECPKFKGQICSGRGTCSHGEALSGDLVCGMCLCDSPYGGINALIDKNCVRHGTCDCSCNNNGCQSGIQCGISVSDSNQETVIESGRCECGYCKCEDGWDHLPVDAVGTELEIYEKKNVQPCICKKSAKCSKSVFGTCDGLGECACGDLCRCHVRGTLNFAGSSSPNSLRIVKGVFQEDQYYDNCRLCTAVLNEGKEDDVDDDTAKEEKVETCPADRCKQFNTCETCANADMLHFDSNSTDIREGCVWCHDKYEKSKYSCQWIVTAVHDCQTIFSRKRTDAEVRNDKEYIEITKTLTDQELLAQECPGPLLTKKQAFAVGGGAFAAIVVIGLIALMSFKLYGHILDKREWEQFERDRQASKWKADSNPLFQSSVSETPNPLYASS